jgi:ribonucleoside-diphosphate reductase alpha chain
MAAWKRGLKTTYYLHMKPRHTAEQSTTTVNKAAAMGKKGFSAVVASSALKELTPQVSPIQKSPLDVPELVPVGAVAKEEVAVMPQQSHSVGFAAVAHGQRSLPLAATPEVISAGHVAPKTVEVAASAVPQSMPSVTIKRPVLVAPSDPQEKLVCDSCQ